MIGVRAAGSARFSALIVRNMATFARRTLFWKYVAYFSGLVSALLVLSGGVGGYFAYRGIHRRDWKLFSARRPRLRRRDCDLHRSTGKTTCNRSPRNSTQAEPVDEEDLRVELITLLRHQPSITELHWIAADGREKFELSRIAPDADGQRSQLVVRLIGVSTLHAHQPAIHRTGVFPARDRTMSSLAMTRNAGGPVSSAEVNLKFVWDVISQIRVGTAGIAYVVDIEVNSCRIPTSVSCFASRIA